MTDETNSDGLPELVDIGDIFATLRAGRTTHPRATFSEKPAYDGARITVLPDEEVSFTEDEEDALAESVALRETNTDFAADAANMEERAAHLDRQLDEGHFDPRTGQRVHAIQGHAREAMERQRTELRNEAAFMRKVAVKKAAHRQAERQRLAAIMQADAIRDEFADGDSNRARIFDEEVTRAEARRAAEQFLVRKYASRLG
jgi:hypothetical protein